jgi:hypothetical protein
VLWKICNKFSLLELLKFVFADVSADFCNAGGYLQTGLLDCSTWCTVIEGTVYSGEL